MNYVEQNRQSLTQAKTIFWLEAWSQKSQAKRFTKKMGFDLVHTTNWILNDYKPEYEVFHIFKKKIKKIKSLTSSISQRLCNKTK